MTLDVFAVTRRLLDLHCNLITLRRWVECESGVPYTCQDARHVFLDAIQGRLVGVALWIRTLGALHENCRGPETIDEHKFFSSLGVDSLTVLGNGWSVGKTEDLMLDTLRHSLVVLVHFKIETMFATILKRFDSKDYRSVRHTAEKLFEEIALGQKADKLKVLRALSSIRISMHNNGIHSPPSFNVTVSGMLYDFQKDRPVKCASWDHIINLLNVILLHIVGEVLKARKVRSIRTVIEDRFSAIATSVSDTPEA